MSAIDRYVEAATRENTRRSYQSALRHFEVEWGGFLPASADMIARYLADQAISAHPPKYENPPQLLA